MTDLRTAAQQALEALLDDCVVQVGPHSWERRSDLAITAIRAALAQQAEPVASGFRVMVCGVDCHPHPGDQHCNGYCTGKTDDPPEATAEQKNQPQITHAEGCWSWGPAHYECACKELAKAKGWGK